MGPQCCLLRLCRASELLIQPEPRSCVALLGWGLLPESIQRPDDRLSHCGSTALAGRPACRARGAPLRCPWHGILKAAAKVRPSGSGTGGIAGGRRVASMLCGRGAGLRRDTAQEKHTACGKKA